MDLAEFCRELVDKTDIVKVISRYVHLTQSGRDYVAPCPFHNESKPSFRVHPDKQFFYCFGCRMAGDVIKFVSEIERIDRIDAIKMLAEEANMELPQFTVEGKKYDKEKKFRLYALMKDAAKCYHMNLSLPSAKIANEYIENRQIPKNIVTRFGLGYSAGNSIIKALESKGYTKNEMQESGIIMQKADRYYDVFSNRLMFPIINNLGEVVAFGGRELDGKSFPKYRNSAKTEIFDKSRTVYGLNLLKKQTLKGGSINYIIICEGYMDIISLHKAGFDMSVASMGTALTASQARQIKNYTSKVVICYDGDNAGQKATLRGLDILKENGLIVKVAQLPENMDPDDVINKMGAAAYQDIITNAITLTEFKLKSIKAKYNLNDYDEKSRYGNEALKCIAELDNLIEAEEYLKMVQRETGYSLDVLKQQLSKPMLDKKETNQSVREKAPEKLTNMEASFVLASIIADKPYALVDETMQEILPSEFSRCVYKSIIDTRLSGLKVSAGMVFADLDESYHAELSNIINYEFIEGDNESKYKKCILLLRCNHLKNKIDKLKSEVAGGNFESLKDIQLLSQELHKLQNTIIDN